MKKILYFILIGLVFGLYSCEEESGKFLYDGPNYVSFIESNSDFTALGGAANEFPIEIGVTTAAAKTYTLEVDAAASTGVEGTHFNVDSKEVSIAAGENIGTMVLTPIFTAVPDEGITIVFNIINTGDTADFSIMTHTISIGKLCPVDFAGEYTGTHTAHASTVVMEATGVVNQLRVYGLAEFVTRDWGETWVNGDGSCVIDFKCANVVIVQDQWIGDSDYPDTYNIYSASGTYDEAANTITLTYNISFSSSNPITTVLTLNSSKTAAQVESFTGKKIR